MSTTITIEEAQTTLAQLIARLIPGDEVVITDNAKPVARLVAEQQPPRQPRRPGSAAGKFFILAEDDENGRTDFSLSETVPPHPEPDRLKSVLPLPASEPGDRPSLDAYPVTRLW